MTKDEIIEKYGDEMVEITREVSNPLQDTKIITEEMTVEEACNFWAGTKWVTSSENVLINFDEDLGHRVSRR